MTNSTSTIYQDSDSTERRLKEQATAWVKKYPDVLEIWKKSDDSFKRAAAETMEELAEVEA